MKKIILVVFIAVCVGKASEGFAQVSAVDSMILVDLYKSCGGAKWANHTNWLTSAPVSTWYGIYNVMGGHVGGIDLKNNNLRGILPKSIGNFPALDDFFIVSGNYLQGTVPATLANISGDVENLSIDNNEFTFDGIEQITPYYNSNHYYLYYPQASIPIHNNAGSLSVSAGGTLANNTYYWYKNNVLFKTTVGDSVLATTAKGAYSVAVTNAVATKLTLYSDTISIGKTTIPIITTVPATVTNLCPATTVTLTSSSTTGNTWSTGATTQSITTDTAGAYSVTVNGETSAVTNVTYKTCTKPKSTGVSAVTSTTATVYWSKEPCKSDYTLEYRKVGTTAFTTVTANDTLHKITGLLPSTNYQWKVRTVCVDTPLTASDYTTFASFTTTSGFADNENANEESNSFSIVPNPAHSIVTVSFVADNVNTVLQVINATGQSIIQKQITSFIGKNTAQLDVSKLAAGIYMLLVKTKSGVELKRFVKE